MLSLYLPSWRKRAIECCSLFKIIKKATHGSWVYEIHVWCFAQAWSTVSIWDTWVELNTVQPSRFNLDSTIQAPFWIVKTLQQRSTQGHFCPDPPASCRPWPPQPRALHILALGSRRDRPAQSEGLRGRRRKAEPLPIRAPRTSSATRHGFQGEIKLLMDLGPLSGSQ